ncbi:carboxypeptidase A2-like isoform X1 [Ostrinia furnacalis]|uniref:carboxypeptidase A2-like isoform X1 n=1 Tax=Ostrinia furnacalis TaxID=93504 RepID=UPI001039E0C9|nr:carboxypeptidase A2-like isoform X1 [Ostrinia furnacalis]
MARRLALLALLACAAAARRPPRHSADISDSEPLDPFSLWDEYEESFETTTSPRPTTSKPSAKVIIRGKGPKVNVTVKNPHEDGKKKIIKTTNINIESHTNFIVTKRPLVNSNSVTKGSQRPVLSIGGDYLWLSAENVKQATRSTTRKPQPVRRPPASRPTTRRPPSSQRPTRRPQPPRRQSTTRKPTTRPIRKTAKPTKAPNKKTTTCSPKNPGWLSTFFQENKLKKTPKKPVNSGWFLGFFSRIYNWISKSNWFGAGGWFEDTEPKVTTSTTTTTVAPLTAATSNWFQSLLDSEESDGIITSGITKKTNKKSLKKNYKGYQLLRTYPDLQWKVNELLDLQEEAQGSGLMWWTSPSLNGSTDLLVPPDLLSDVKDHLKSSKIDFDVVIWDLQKAITYENPRLSKKQRLELEQLRGHPMTWRRYHRYADILRYLEYLQHSHGDLVELVPLGRSSEGLPLVAVKISLPSNDSYTKDSNNKDYKKKWKLRSRMKPAVWLDGGTHAREWIAPAVATWILHALIEGEKGLGAEYEVLKQADFYIMPVLNPDGYEHTHTHDRLWRKTRSRLPDHSDDYYVGWFPWNWGRTECVGVDADRNWDYHWGEKDASRDPCADNYAGPHPFSEPETRAVSEFLAEHRDLIKVFITLHAYSQSWLVPSTHAHAPFADDGVLMEMGKLATIALADLYGTKYQIGTASEIRQPASGMAHDWAKARAGIKFSYHVDLRDSYGPYGFLLPGAQIVSTARETWQAVKAIVDNLSPS